MQNLTLFNIDEWIEDDELSDLISTFAPVSDVQIKSSASLSKPRIAKVRMKSTNDAVTALLALHGYHLNGRSLSVTFWHEAIP